MATKKLRSQICAFVVAASNNFLCCQCRALFAGRKAKVCFVLHIYFINNTFAYMHVCVFVWLHAAKMCQFSYTCLVSTAAAADKICKVWYFSFFFKNEYMKFLAKYAAAGAEKKSSQKLTTGSYHFWPSRVAVVAAAA